MWAPPGVNAKSTKYHWDPKSMLENYGLLFNIRNVASQQGSNFKYVPPRDV